MQLADDDDDDDDDGDDDDDDVKKKTRNGTSHSAYSQSMSRVTRSCDLNGTFQFLYFVASNILMECSRKISLNIICK